MPSAIGKSKKYLDTVSKLLNQAERAPEGSPERETFMEKAIALAQANAIDLAVARAHQAKKEKVEEIEERRVKVGQYINHGDHQRVSSNTKWLTELLTEIAPPNDVKCLISRDAMFVYLVGFPSDLEVVERLYASLAVQMVSEGDRLIKSGAHKEVQRVPLTKREPNPRYDPNWEYTWGSDKYYRERYGRKTLDVVQHDEKGDAIYVEKPVSTDGRVWRANFYQGFINRVVSRMWEAKREARKAAGVTDINDESNATAIVLRDKEAERAKDWDERTKFVRGTYSGPEISQYDDKGREKGFEVGSKASLGTESRVGNQERKAIS